MKYEKYDTLTISSDALEFVFISEGPKGVIQKVVQFMVTDNPEIYNLAFGDLLPNGKVDDEVKNNNKDRNKILATVAATVYEFTSRYPQKIVFFTGSTAERTRLYRMALSINYEEISKDFDIYGVEASTNIVEPFIKNRPYVAFVLKRIFH